MGNLGDLTKKEKIQIRRQPVSKIKHNIISKDRKTNLHSLKKLTAFDNGWYRGTFSMDISAIEITIVVKLLVETKIKVNQIFSQLKPNLELI